MTKIHNTTSGQQGSQVNNTGRIHKGSSPLFWPTFNSSGVKVHKPTSFVGHLDHVNVHLENISSGILGLLHHQGLAIFPVNVSDKWATWNYRDMEWESNPTLWGNTKLEIVGVDKSAQTVSFNLTTEYPDSPVSTADLIDHVWPVYFNTKPRYLTVVFPLFMFEFPGLLGQTQSHFNAVNGSQVNPFDETVTNSQGLTLFQFEVNNYGADPNDIDDTSHLDRYFTSFVPYNDPKYYMNFMMLWAFVKKVYDKAP